MTAAECQTRRPPVWTAAASVDLLPRLTAEQTVTMSTQPPTLPAWTAAASVDLLPRLTAEQTVIKLPPPVPHLTSLCVLQSVPSTHHGPQKRATLLTFSYSFDDVITASHRSHESLL